MKTIKPLINVLTLFFSLLAVILLWVAGVNPYDLIMSAWWPVLMLLQFSLVLLWFTSIPFRYVLLALGTGASVVPLITYLVQKPLNLLLEGSALQRTLSQLEFFGTVDLQAPLIAPITEEITKLIPVFLVFILLQRFKKYRLLSPIDFGLLGLASGAGFDIFENICRVFNGFYDVIGLYRMPIIEPIPSFFGIHLFPSMIKSEYLSNPMIWFGHTGLTGSIVLAFGYFIYLKKKRFLVLPVLVYIISVFDHSMWNWYQPLPEQLWAKTLPPLTLYGRLIPILFVLGLLLNVYLLLKNKKLFKQELNQMKFEKENSTHFYDKIITHIANNKRKNQITNAFRHYLKKA
jgi:RsiW-degrading membrane proteinase PrsW (M82 family)